LADVLSTFLVFVIARFIYTGWLDARFGWNPIYFVLLLVLIKVIHDILFYFLVIRRMKQGTNEMIDVFKQYANEHGASIISAHAIIMISSATLAMVMKHQSVGVQAFVFGLATYALPYILYTEPQWDKRAPVPTKEVAKDDKDS
jgi:glucan phosphoethanolaminetransferase (alkaline phosphatase superfamily)